MHFQHALIFSFAAFTIGATDLSQIHDNEMKALAKGKASQERINRAHAKTQDLTHEHREVLAQITSLKKYNQQMAALIAQQDKEKRALKQQIKNSSRVDRSIFPLMTQMIDGLEQFIDLDVPFLSKERKARVASLRATMKRTDQTPEQKFKKLWESYEAELEYGRTIETWQGNLPLPDGEKNIAVNFMRFGRVSWVYQTLDKSETALWNGKGWTLLEGWSGDIGHAMKVAKEQVPPSLLLIPIKEAQ